MAEALAAWLLLCAGLGGMIWECLRPGLVLPGTLGLGAALAAAYLLVPRAPAAFAATVLPILAVLALLAARGRRNKAIR
jgi:hypothetical protein